ncbi:MAG: TlpA family protein disulfide reductase [Gammaproteobacteria bacterium]|nr:TlpA family protein disulfide reductase [Gammaproteobacteria bacterium]MDH5275394.1 TlpA family protein disulfide reductase [Gammaproteobacteria bacterium]
MRKLLALGLILTATSLPNLAATASNAVAGQPAPDFTLKSTSGENLRLSEWRGEVVLLSFWAAWCGRCTDQLEQLDKLQQQYQAKGVRVVTVNIDRDSQPARDAASRRSLLVLHDGDQSVARQYDLSDLPLTVLMDAHGRVRHVHQKYRGGDAALYDEELAALLAE